MGNTDIAKVIKVVWKCLDFVGGRNYFQTHTGMIYYPDLSTLNFSVILLSHPLYLHPPLPLTNTNNPQRIG